MCSPIENLLENSLVLCGVFVLIVLGIQIREAGLMRLGLVSLLSVSLLTLFDVMVVVSVLSLFSVVVMVCVLIVTGFVLAVCGSLFIGRDFEVILSARRVLGIALLLGFRLCLMSVLWSLFLFLFVFVSLG
jgi:hypothetical protein